MKVLVRIYGRRGDLISEHEVVFGRVPCVGERISIDEEIFEVRTVTHYPIESEEDNAAVLWVYK